MKVSLDFIELGISKHYSEFFEPIKESLSKIQQRVIKLMTKKDNAVLQHFLHNFNIAGSSPDPKQKLGETNTTSMLDLPAGLPLETLAELRLTSEPLYEFANSLTHKI